MDSTPMGATLHWMDDGFDTGPIIAQERFDDDGVMTSREVYERQCVLCVKLFKDNLPLVLSGKAPSIPQGPGGTYHRAQDIVAATTYHYPHDTLSADRVLKLARATDFGSYGIDVQGTKLTIRVVRQ
mgnify:CR=1 FL=1